MSFLEIPLFHVLNARVTFSNLCGCDEPVSSVTVQSPPSPQEAPESGIMELICSTIICWTLGRAGDLLFPLLLLDQAPPPLQCEVDPSVFEPPPEYTQLGPGRSEPMRDEDDNLLQFAIQQSLLDAGTESDQVTLFHYHAHKLSCRLFDAYFKQVLKAPY